MSQNYLPFFRKYRPQAFKDIVGQENLVKTLSAAIETGKISHAYLFSGPRGTGKTSSARIFAKSLNCKNAPTLTPCQKCQSCIDITNSTGVDVIELDAATNRGIDDAKKIIEQTQYAPMNGKYKIFIIDEAHMLTKEAFNALLKTLEEPPKNVIFILATTEPHKIIETIVSRCQRFDFKRITTDDIVKKLEDVSKAENIKITREALYTIANNVSGGMRDSLALLDQISILGQREEITKETIENLIGKITFDVLYDILDKIASGNIEASIKALNEIYKKGNEPKNFTENLIEFLRNAIIVKSTNEKEFEFAKINSGEAQKLLNSSWDKVSLIKLLDKTLELYKDIKNASNPYLWSEVLIVELCAINEISNKAPRTEKRADIKIQTPIQKPKEVIKQEAPTSNKPVFEEKEAEPIVEEKEAEPVFEEQETEPEVREDKVEAQKTEVFVNKEESAKSPLSQSAQAWADILNSIESIPAKFFFSGISKLVNIDDKKITLGFLNQNSIKQAQSPAKTNALKAAIKNVFENELSVEYIIITKDTPTLDVQTQIKQTPKKVYREEYATNPQEAIEEEEPSTKPEKKAKKEKPVEIYSNKTKEMMDNFSGKVIG